MGGGVVGATAAYLCAREGSKTLLVDRTDAGRATDAGAGIISPRTSTRHETLFDLGLRSARVLPDPARAPRGGRRRRHGLRGLRRPARRGGGGRAQAVRRTHRRCSTQRRALHGRPTAGRGERDLARRGPRRSSPPRAPAPRRPRPRRRARRRAAPQPGAAPGGAQRRDVAVRACRRRPFARRGRPRGRRRRGRRLVSGGPRRHRRRRVVTRASPPRSG